MVLLLETIIVINNNIRCWWWWSCFLVARGLHRPFILIHHRKDNNTKSFSSLLSLSLSLSRSRRRRERERESDIKSDDEVFILKMMFFFPNAPRESRHTLWFDDANTIMKKKKQQTKKRRRRRGSNSRTRWVFSNSYVSLLFTMLVLCIGYLNAEIEIEVWTVGL